MTARPAVRRCAAPSLRSLVLTAAVLSAALDPLTSSAQSPPAGGPSAAATTRAREAFQEGIKREETGHYDQPLLRFREVVAVKKTP